MYYGIGTSNGGPLAPWRYVSISCLHRPVLKYSGRWIFLLLGVITIAIGICCFFFLPDQPTDAKWLSEREKIIAVERVARSQVRSRHQNVAAVQKAHYCLLDRSQEPDFQVVSSKGGINRPRLLAVGRASKH